MKYSKLGGSGLSVSKICLGTMGFGNTEAWMVEMDEAQKIIKRAVDLGVNFFDTANVYSNGRSEQIVGTVLRDHRNDVVIATKVFFPTGSGPNDRGLSRFHILMEVEKSLERLQTDHIDLYQTHRWDYSTEIEETLCALDNLVHLGKVRYIGGSTMYSWQFAKALFTSDRLRITKFVSMQDQYNLCYREEEREMIPLCIDQKIGILPWSPLARGFLTGKYQRGKTPDSARFRSDKPFAARFFRTADYDVLEEIERIAKEKSVTPSQIALSWLFHKEYVTSPIVGATRVRHLEEAVEALEVRLDGDDMKRLEAPYELRTVTPEM